MVTIRLYIDQFTVTPSSYNRYFLLPILILCLSVFSLNQLLNIFSEIYVEYTGSA